MFTTSILVVSASLAAGPELTFEGASRHPTVNLTPEDVARARKRVAADSGARAWLDALMKSVARWDDKDAAWVRSVMPGEGACFAYGFTGCPICGGRWSCWGGARCSFDNAGRVTCSGGHLLPDKDHPDPGTGYRGKDGRIHYFVGSHNAWVVETLIFKLAKPYSMIYLLTRDERAGRMAAVILDEIARIYPSCDKGSWDYPSNPPSGRLCRPWYQVARVLVHFVDMYDWIFDHPALDEPSSRGGLTRRQNIERHLLLNGAKYCYDTSVKSGGLHNGQADYLRGVLAVGVVLGIPEYVTWPVDGTFGIRTMMANNVDRDGRYFETSAGYALHTRNLYLTFAEPLLNYRGSVYPHGLNLYDDARFESFYVLPQMATVCLGHDAPFGDAAPVFRRRTAPPYRPHRVYDDVFAERLASRMSDPTKRAGYGALLAHLRSWDAEGKRQDKALTEWQLFHQTDEPSPGGALDDRMKRYLGGSLFFGQKGLAILRPGKDADAQAAILRFGPSLNHGHYDDLNVNYFAQGAEMTYDIGYSLGSTHTQVGWAKQTISHNTVVVDEKPQGGGQSGGSLHRFVDLPGLVLAEGSSKVYAHLGVDVYRRLIALTDRYALDVFRVRGGRRHDLPLHGLSTEVEFDGITFGEPEPGSLAGEQYRWGELQLNDGDMKGHPGKPYWNPPPHNGYGFLCRPAMAVPTASWSATWVLKDGKTRFRLLPLHDQGTEAITAVAPGLYPTFPKARHVIRRRRGEALSSCFVSIWQGFKGGKEASPVRAVRRIDAGAPLSDDSPVALAVALANGHRDLWCLAPGPDSTVRGRDGSIDIAFEGALARCRVDGDRLVSAQISSARRLHVAGWTLQLDAPDRSAKVVGALGKADSTRIDASWPTDGRYDGDAIYFSNSRYSRNTAYTLDKIDGDRLVVQQTGTLLGRGEVHEIKDAHTLITRTPHQYARSVTRRGSSGIFRGKLLRTTDGRVGTRIREVRYGQSGTMTIDVDSTDGLETGQTFNYHDVQPGDTVTVQHHLSLVRAGDGTYALRANTDVTLTAPGKATLTYQDRSGKTRPADGGRIPRDALPAHGETKITLVE